jgi:hypothetical protein
MDSVKENNVFRTPVSLFASIMELSQTEDPVVSIVWRSCDSPPSKNGGFKV